MIRKCQWCGKSYEGNVLSFCGRTVCLCGEKCEIEYRNAHDHERRAYQRREREREAIRQKRLNTEKWAERLVSHPEDGKKCPWSELELTQTDILRIVLHSPKVIEFVPRSKIKEFSAYDLMQLLERHPECVKYCDLSNLDMSHWNTILGKNPELLTYCDIIDELGESSVISYRLALGEISLSSIPKEKEYLFYGHLNWDVILSCNPGIVEKCNKDILGSIYSGIWSSVICKQPQLFPVAKSCGADRKFDKYDWDRIIKAQPQFKNEFWKWRIKIFFSSIFRKLFYTVCVSVALGGVCYGVLHYADESTLTMMRDIWGKVIAVGNNISSKVSGMNLLVGFFAIIFVLWWIRRAIKIFSKKRWKFLFLGLFLGFLGLHLAYAKRWKLFGLSFAIALMAYWASSYGLLFVFWGLTTFFIKKDGNGNRM